ncbi:GMC oxidoreductase [Aestuariibaculum suncheonense]|uniref:GMC family oxidoreductase n=1 Tax=Aestuariibaculum suncheonense TaxID=1028745 RepID=A0A8J6QKA4_9FLAO|nr:GMC family oxidoreductase [Aestuariibaculum suncheonense]MBD0836286.1 GMC family oxidoreductase [Aestuariibaculum suncheonense]
MSKLNNEVVYDAIVIGTGISGGWAAKELCEQGLKTLVLERGRNVEHIKDYPTMIKEPWEFKYRGLVNREDRKRQEKQDRTGFAVREEHKHWFVDDLKHPYNEDKRFDWIRGYHVGGRSITWGRQTLRLSDLDFEANKKEGIAVDWPIRYKDISPWYDKVERFIGVCGEKLGLSYLPDGIFTPPMELNCVEQEFRNKIENEYDNRYLIMGRFAHLTGDVEHEGRVNCQNRNKCIRGCMYGGYFSSNASTLPAAAKTGNMTLRPHSIVNKIIYDNNRQLATGVEVIDAETHETLTFSAKVIFCCASAIASTAILMHSKSKRFPNGLGNDSGELGHNLMDHHFKVGATATVDGFEDKYYKGHRPTSFHIPRFRNLGDSETKQDYLRGFGFQGSASRTNWQNGIRELSYGKTLKEQMFKPGPWKIGMTGFGECLPYHENRMYLNYNELDEWGIPTITFDSEFKENEMKMREDMEREAVNMMKRAGFKNVKGYNEPCYPGHAIHEMGTARMGHDPKTSVLNKHNQVHAVPNVYVTDGACMTSSPYQNPSLTYMALSARAANHAVEQIKNNRF